MFFLTTAIDYTNGSPHIGHAYEKVLADVIARYRRLRDDKVFFLTGVDQHGQKVQQTAEKEGVHPATYVKRTTKKFLNLWDKLDVRYDGWAETTDDRHKACVRQILTDLNEKGEIYTKSTKGFYSVRQEQYLTDRDRNEQGEFGAEWGEVVELEEENWYFRLSSHVEWLKGFIEENPDFIQPFNGFSKNEENSRSESHNEPEREAPPPQGISALRRAELINALERSEGVDLCISRPKERLRWGIEFPFAPDYVTYVWFDALINYISFAGYKASDDPSLPDFNDLWTNAAANGNRPTHIIGKDILVPAHGIYWPCMLHAMGFTDEQIPRILVHGWWNIGGEKMSKSLGNIVDPENLVAKFGVDATRYYLMRDITTGWDSDFDIERLVKLFNTELANELGNLCNRAVSMTVRFASGVIEYEGEGTAGSKFDRESDESLKIAKCNAYSKFCFRMERYDFGEAIQGLFILVREANRYAEYNKPWDLAKDPQHSQRLKVVLSNLCQAVAHSALMLSVFLPDAACKLATQLGHPSLLNIKIPNWEKSTFTQPSGIQENGTPWNYQGRTIYLHKFLEWKLLANGHTIGKPKPVFPRIVLEEADPT